MAVNEPLYVKIYELLRSKIAACKFSPDVRLPSVQALASEFRVSRDTILKALDRLEKDGMVHRYRGSGVYIKDKIIKKEIQLRKPRAQEIAGQIIQDISNGILKVGNYLPLQKELQYRYKISKGTISQAIKFLESKGMIHPKGSGYAVGPESAGVSKDLLVCLIGEHLVSSLRSRPRRDFDRAFRNELEKHGITRIQHISFPSPRAEDRSSSLALDSTVGDCIRRAGAVGIFYSYPQPRLRQVSEVKRKVIMRTDLSVLARSRLPTLWFDYSRIHDQDPSFAKTLGKNTFPFCFDHYEAGKQVATYLACLGHTNMVLVDFYTSAYWCKNRVKGFRDRTERICAGSCTIGEYHANAEKRKLRRKIQSSLESQRGKDAFTSFFFKDFHFAKIDPVGEAAYFLFRLMEKESYFQVLEPIFRQALKQKDTTVWICLDPFVAWAAWGFLNQRHIKKPEQISLVCIDDDETSLLLGITAYNFQVDQMGYLAAHCLLGDIPIKKNRQGIVECPGRIIERGSVRRCMK